MLHTSLENAIMYHQMSQRHSEKTMFSTCSKRSSLRSTHIHVFFFLLLSSLRYEPTSSNIAAISVGQNLGFSWDSGEVHPVWWTGIKPVDISDICKNMYICFTNQATKKATSSFNITGSCNFISLPPQSTWIFQKSCSYGAYCCKDVSEPEHRNAPSCMENGRQIYFGAPFLS